MLTPLASAKGQDSVEKISNIFMTRITKSSPIYFVIFLVYTEFRYIFVFGLYIDCGASKRDVFWHNTIHSSQSLPISKQCLYIYYCTYKCSFLERLSRIKWVCDLWVILNKNEFKEGLGRNGMERMASRVVYGFVKWKYWLKVGWDIIESNEWIWIWKKWFDLFGNGPEIITEFGK